MNSSLNPLESGSALGPEEGWRCALKSLNPLESGSALGHLPEYVRRLARRLNPLESGSALGRYPATAP